LSHCTGDALFYENASQVRSGNIPQVMCALRNVTISLLSTSQNTEITYAFRYFAATLKEVLTLLGASIDNRMPLVQALAVLTDICVCVTMLLYFFRKNKR